MPTKTNEIPENIKLILERNAHISNEEVLRDIRDTEHEI